MIRTFFKANARFPSFSVHDLDIMRAAMRNNDRNGLTGFLLRSDNTYLNVLEGPQDAVEYMLSRVARDSRAYGLQVFSLRSVTSRHYPAWSMGYNESQPDRGKTCAIHMFLTKPETYSEDEVMAVMLKRGLRHIKNDRQSANTLAG